MTTELEPMNCLVVKSEIYSSKILVYQTENHFSVSKAQKFCDFSRNVPLDVGKIMHENLLR